MLVDWRASEACHWRHFAAAVQADEFWRQMCWASCPVQHSLIGLLLRELNPLTRRFLLQRPE
jgi:hypothetical protein